MKEDRELKDEWAKLQKKIEDFDGRLDMDILFLKIWITITAGLLIGTVIGVIV